MLPEELEQIVKSNQLSLARIEKQIEKIRRRLMWDRIAGVLKIVLILAPIIFGILYLAPKLKQLMGTDNPFANILKIYTSGSFDDLDSNVGSQTTGSVNANDIKNVFCNPVTRDEAIDKICK